MPNMMKINPKVVRFDHTKWFYAWVVVVACSCVVCLMSACEEDTIRTYEAPKSPPYTPPAAMGPVVGDGSTTASSNITWDQPESWQVAADGSSMARVTFEVSSDAPDAASTRITVTELSGPAGGALGNINRWRGQVGLPPVDQLEHQPITPVEIDGQPAGLIDLASPPEVAAGFERILVALLPRAQTDSTWFFKMTGPDEVVTSQKQNFIAFVESVRFEGTDDE